MTQSSPKEQPNVRYRYFVPWLAGGSRAHLSQAKATHQSPHRSRRRRHGLDAALDLTGEKQSRRANAAQSQTPTFQLPAADIPSDAVISVPASETRITRSHASLRSAEKCAEREVKSPQGAPHGVGIYVLKLQCVLRSSSAALYSSHNNASCPFAFRTADGESFALYLKERITHEI